MVFYSITSGNRTLTINYARAILGFGWLMAITVALYPIIYWRHLPVGYYGSNGLCFPLHIDEPYLAGWQYSTIVVIGVNFAAVVVMLTLYMALFLVLSRDRKFSRPGGFNQRKEDLALAVRFFCIVLTDSLCWLPLVTVKLAALSGRNIDRKYFKDHVTNKNLLVFSNRLCFIIPFLNSNRVRLAGRIRSTD